MGTWAELRQVLDHLASRDERPLQGWPDPRVADRQPPFRIQLAPWASEIAAELHDRFGQDVDLTVGALHYPERQKIWPGGAPPPPPAPVPPLPVDQLSVSLDAPVVVASGDTLSSHLRVHNHGLSPEAVVTNGTITSRIVDPATGQVVGGYAGARILPRVVFEIAPAQSKLIPLLVGTASGVSELGYAIPPGNWALDAVLQLQAGSFRTPPLPMTIVERAPSP